MVIDSGNSFVKIGIFEKDSLKEKRVLGQGNEVKIFLQNTPAQHILLSSVATDVEQLVSLSKASGQKIILHPRLPLPISNKYASPETLGSDRLAAACGAWKLFPNQDSLVIDVGTCINYEFVSSDGAYHGGAISPGVRMRFDSMHKLTAKLPAVTPVTPAPLTGDTTVSCLQSGVMNGMLEEIKGIISRYTNDYPGIRVILCGGDAHFFENDLKPSIFVAPDLVLMGLNSILLHNVDE